MDLFDSLPVEHPANLSASQGSDAARKINAGIFRWSFLDWRGVLGSIGLSGKTCPEFDLLMTDTPSEGFSESLLSAGFTSPGGNLTENLCEWPVMRGLFRSEGPVCCLSDILETGAVDRRYYLKPKAAKGILHRAEKRGKMERLQRKLPVLLTALSDVAARGAESTEV